MAIPDITQRLLDAGIIAIIRADSSDQLLQATQALLDGGITAMIPASSRRWVMSGMAMRSSASPAYFPFINWRPISMLTFCMSSCCFWICSNCTI